MQMCLLHFKASKDLGKLKAIEIDIISLHLYFSFGRCTERID